jgi:hypothetical protein
MGGTCDYAAPQPGTITARAQAQKQENRKRTLLEWGGIAAVASPCDPTKHTAPTLEAHQAHQAHEGCEEHKDTNKAPAVTLQPSRGDARLATPAVGRCDESRSRVPGLDCSALSYGTRRTAHAGLRPARVARVAVWTDADSSSVTRRALICNADEDTKPVCLTASRDQNRVQRNREGIEIKGAPSQPAARPGRVSCSCL